jgi:hypothetical protein
VKYSIATTTNLLPPCEGGSGLIRSIPHLCYGHVGGMSYTATCCGFGVVGLFQ